MALARRAVGGSEPVPSPNETLFAILWLSEKHFKFCFEITSKKLEKSRIWVSQTLPKSSQKPSKINVPKNMRFFTDFCSINVLSRKCRHQFRIGFYSVFCLSDTFFRFAVRTRFGSEKPTKTLPERGSSPSKIDVKNVLFYNIDFCGFWPQVGRSWRPKMEASWLQIPSSSLLGCPL